MQEKGQNRAGIKGITTSLCATNSTFPNIYSQSEQANCAVGLHSQQSVGQTREEFQFSARSDYVTPQLNLGPVGGTVATYLPSALPLPPYFKITLWRFAYATNLQFSSQSTLQASRQL